MGMARIAIDLPLGAALEFVRRFQRLLILLLLSTFVCEPSFAQSRDTGEAASPLVVLGRSPLRADSYDNILDILLEDAAQSRHEEGVLSWDLFQPEDGTRDLFAVERYKDRATFDRHLQAPYVKVFLDNIDAAVREGEEQSAIFMKALLPTASKPILSPQTTKNLISVLSVKPESMPMTMESLLAVARAARHEEGNLVYDVFQELSAPHRLVVFQRWETSNAYAKHCQQTRQKQLDALLIRVLTQPHQEIWMGVRDIGH
ncbi:putative quinol monooxygenase [Pseudomonas citronellolis]|uniref:putative quinol monooxygenase n=1 Tax=Pseudomonas citronellolis TaxID=53408 RepID=UPI0008530C51|nr:antibiotic biosynthesis monooxygenase [Pseudomonas humi]